MRLNSLLTVPAVSALCITAGMVVSADPISFENDADTVLTTAQNPSLMRESRMAFSSQGISFSDEVNALMRTIDEIPGLMLAVSNNPQALSAGGKGDWHPYRYISGAAVGQINLPGIANAAPTVFKAQSTFEAQTYLSNLNLESGQVEAGSSDFRFDMPALDPVAQQSTVGIPAHSRSASDVPPASGKQLNASAENTMPLTDFSGDAMDNGLDPQNSGQGGQTTDEDAERRKRKKREAAYWEAGGISVTVLVIALLLGNEHHHGTPPPIPETSSAVGLSALFAGGALGLMRMRRRPVTAA